MKDHCRRIRSLDFVDHDKIALPGADYAVWRKDDLVPARSDILRRQGRAVGKFDPLADLEGVSLAAVCRRWHGRAQVADELVGLARVVRVGADQDTLKGCGRVDRRVGLLAM